MAFAKTLSRRAVGGAFAYAAPEQLSGECEHLERRSDIYSLGRLLHFFLLEQDPPILIERVPPLEELNTYPEGLVKIIRRCTHRDLPMRYASVDELIDDLGRYEETEQVGAFGPNLTLAQRHWQQAETHTRNGEWSLALGKAEQAQQYLKGIDEQRSQLWSFYSTIWRFRAGEWHLAPHIVYLWFRRLSFPVALLVIMFALSPLAIPISQYVQSQARQDQLEKSIRILSQLPSLKSTKARQELAFIKGSPQRLAETRTRLALLLSKSKAATRCRYFSLLYLLAPRYSDVLLVQTKDGQRKIHPVLLSRLLKPSIARHWGSIRCSREKRFLWLELTHPNKKRKMHQHGMKLHFPHSDMRFLFAENMTLNDSDFTKSLLVGSHLNKSSLISVRLTNANLTSARLREVNLLHAKIHGALFHFADLRRANLRSVKANFADFRGAMLKGANVIYGEYQGAIFDAHVLPELRKGRIDHNFIRHAICLSTGFFLMKGPVDRCYRWHWRKFTKQTTRGKRPRFCPQRLSIYSMFIAYPPGRLQHEGLCPWQSFKVPKGWTIQTPSTRPTSHPAIPKK